MEQSKDTKRKVSVVVCTYNGECYIREQIDSILRQTYPLHEIILQDDGSTDGTFAILADYARRHSNVSAWRNEAGQGINPNFFSAMARATGEFIALSDQDDVWESDKVERQMAALAHGGPGALLCFGRTVPFAEGCVLVRSDERVPNYSLLRLCFANTIPGHTMLFRRRLLELIPDDATFRSNRIYDVVLGMTAAAHDGIVYVDKRLVNQRRHAAAATYTKPMDNTYTLRNIVRTVADSFRLYRELKPELMHRAALNLHFLSQMESRSPHLADAQRMLRAQQKGTLCATLQMSLFCLRHQSELFFTRERPSLRGSLRALLFPVFCSEYIRYMSKSSTLNR